MTDYPNSPSQATIHLAKAVRKQQEALKVVSDLLEIQGEWLHSLDERISALESPLSTRLHNVPNGTPYEEDPGDWLCSCGQERVNASYTVERAGAKHSLGRCGPCCTHGVFATDDCEVCESAAEDNPGDCVGSKVCRPPEWRASVDAARHFLTGEEPLVTVLRSLACVADDSKVTDANLARIVAVAEGQVGDGWKADPDAVLGHGNAGSHMCDIDCLIAALSAFDRWRVLGHRAARILRSLLDGAS